MNLFCTGIIQEFGGFPRLGTAHDRVVDQQQPLPIDRIADMIWEEARAFLE